VLLGAKWAFAGTILTILALRGPAHLVERTLGWLHVAAGRPERWMRWGVVSCVGQLIALFCGLPFGATGIAVAYVISAHIFFIPAIVYAGQPLGITTRQVLAIVGPQFIASLLVIGLGFLIKRFLLGAAHPVLTITVTTVVCGGVYLAVMSGIFRVTQPLQLGLSLLRERLPVRFFPMRAAKSQV
jgi:PST family polysaccharide transporter